MEEKLKRKTRERGRKKGEVPKVQRSRGRERTGGGRRGGGGEKEEGGRDIAVARPRKMERKNISIGEGWREAGRDDRKEGIHRRKNY